MSNSTLGQYEMVMQLSEETINDLFSDLKDEGTIHDVWSIRMKLDGRQQVINESVVINENYTDDDNPSFEDVQNKFEKAFEDAKNKENMMGFVAEIDAPSISIINKEQSNVRFNIPFETGKMARSYIGIDEIDTWDLDGIIYVFIVQLDKMSPPYKEANFVNETARKNVESQVEEQMKSTSLTPKDFTIESLFLNFENADFIADRAYTIDSDDTLESTQWNDLQKLIQQYFKDTLTKDNNPYVLGYGITVPKLEDRVDAVFQPMSLNLSTSFVAALDDKGDIKKDAKKNTIGDSERSSLNYLMMLTTPPPKDDAAGIMRSLITNKSILGIDGDQFYDKYLKDSLIKNVISSLNESINDLDKKASSDVVSPIGFPEIGNQGSSSDIEHTGEFETEAYKDFNTLVNDGLSIGTVTIKSYYGKTHGSRSTTSVDQYYKDIQLTPMINLSIYEDTATEPPRTALQVSVDFKMSIDYKTDGSGMLGISKGEASSTNYGLGGEFKSIAFILYPGAEGIMVIKSIQVGTEEFSKTSGKDSTISDVNSKISGGNFYSKLNSEEFLTSVQEALTSKIDTFPSIVLPISNVYMYKSIELTGSENNINTITFQSTYSPEYEIDQIKGDRNV